MILVVTYSAAARTGLRNVCRRHEDHVVRRFGRAALLEATTYGAFLALRLRATHAHDVQIEWTEPFNEFVRVDEDVRAAAAPYANRETAPMPYASLAARTDHPAPHTMNRCSL